jgi:hypothetical protein
MRSLSVQVQPHRAPDLDMKRLNLAFKRLSKRGELISTYSFDKGDDVGSYYNYTFSTTKASALWQAIKREVYGAPEFHDHMSKASMAMLSSETGWEAYSMLFHWDSAVEIDTAPAL